MAEGLTRDGHDFDPVTDVCSRCDSEGCRTLAGMTCAEVLVRQLVSEREDHKALYEQMKQAQAERDTYKRGFENSENALDEQIDSGAEIGFERILMRQALRDVIVMRGADFDLWGKEWGDWIRRNDDLLKASTVDAGGVFGDTKEEASERPKVRYLDDDWFYGGPDNDACTRHRIYRDDGSEHFVFDNEFSWPIKEVDQPCLGCGIGTLKVFRRQLYSCDNDNCGAVSELQVEFKKASDA